MSRIREDRPARPLATLEHDVFYHCQKTADWLLRDLEELLEPEKLSPTQYNVLRILRGSASEGLACHEISERMISRDPDMTRLLDRLEDRDLIDRHRERSDRRVIRVKISTEGVRLLRKLDEDVRAVQRKQLAHLGERRLRLLGNLLEQVRSKERRGDRTN